MSAAYCQSVSEKWDTYTAARAAFEATPTVPNMNSALDAFRAWVDDFAPPDAELLHTNLRDRYISVLRNQGQQVPTNAKRETSEPTNESGCVVQFPGRLTPKNSRDGGAIER